MSKGTTGRTTILALALVILITGCVCGDPANTKRFSVSVVVDEVLAGNSVVGSLLAGADGIDLRPGTKVALSLRAMSVPVGQEEAARDVIRELLARSVFDEPRMSCNGVGTATPWALAGRCDIRVPLVINDPQHPCSYLIGGEHEDSGVRAVDLISTLLSRGMLTILPDELDRWAKVDTGAKSGISTYRRMQEWAKRFGCGVWSQQATEG